MTSDALWKTGCHSALPYCRERQQVARNNDDLDGRGLLRLREIGTVSNCPDRGRIGEGEWSRIQYRLRRRLGTVKSVENGSTRECRLQRYLRHGESRHRPRHHKVIVHQNAGALRFKSPDVGAVSLRSGYATLIEARGTGAGSG